MDSQDLSPTKDLQTLEKVTNSQKSDTTTITFSSPSQTITMDSQDLSPTKLPNVAEKECQTVDGVFLSVEEYICFFTPESIILS